MTTKQHRAAMSARARDNTVSASGRFLWSLIETFADIDGRNAFPSVETLAEISGKNRKWVFHHLTELISNDWLTRGKRTGKSGFAVNSYTIIFPSCVPETGTHEALAMRPQKGDMTGLMI